MKAGQIPRAQSIFDNISQGEISENSRRMFERIISQGQGGNTIALRISEFEETDSLSSLMNLLNELKEKDDHRQLAVYAKIYFERVPEENNLSRLVSALDLPP